MHTIAARTDRNDQRCTDRAQAWRHYGSQTHVKPHSNALPMPDDKVANAHAAAALGMVSNFSRLPEHFDTGAPS